MIEASHQVVALEQQIEVLELVMKGWSKLDFLGKREDLVAHCWPFIKETIAKQSNHQADEDVICDRCDKKAEHKAALVKLADKELCQDCHNSFETFMAGVQHGEKAHAEEALPFDQQKWTCCLCKKEITEGGALGSFLREGDLYHSTGTCRDVYQADRQSWLDNGQKTLSPQDKSKQKLKAASSAFVKLRKTGRKKPYDVVVV